MNWFRPKKKYVLVKLFPNAYPDTWYRYAVYSENPLVVSTYSNEYLVLNDDGTVDGAPDKKWRPA